MNTRSLTVVVLSLASVTACGAPERPASAPTTQALSPREVLPFVADDYPRALAEAKRTHRPLFVDTWAPWCHSCLSMRAYVFTDPSLAALADDFVWLAVDTEKETNAPFVTRFPHQVSPTLWVIDPDRETPILKWGGTATAKELVDLLSTARLSAPEHATKTTLAFVRGNHALAAGRTAEAESAYREALTSAAPDDPHRARAAEALISILSNKSELVDCVRFAREIATTLRPGSSHAAVLAQGLACAREAKRKDDVAVLAKEALVIAEHGEPGMVADDRSALFEEVVETEKDAGSEREARNVARTWATFLEGEAARAPNSEARAVFDAHRLSAYLAMGEPERAVPMLSQSEREFQADYNPPARLARAYLEMKRLPEADSAIKRAMSRVYGPRVMRVAVLAADIAKAREDRAGEVQALEVGLAKTDVAPLTPGQQKLRGTLAARLRALRP